MAAEVAREAMGAVTLDDDSFDYMLALALDGETDAVAAFLAEPCDDDEAAAALAAEVLNALRRTGFVEPDVAEEAPAARSSDAAPLPKAPEPSAPDRAATPPAKDRDEAKAATATTPPTVRPRPPSEDDGLPSDDDDEEAALQRLLDETDDFASAWTARNAEGKAWGGRGAGGRGVARRYQTMSARTKDVVVDGVTLAFLGRELLARSELRLAAGRRYALLGRNGVGKSTLLRRIAAGAFGARVVVTNGSRRGRGCDLDRPKLVAATPRLRPGSRVATTPRLRPGSRVAATPRLRPGGALDAQLLKSGAGCRVSRRTCALATSRRNRR